MKAKFKYRPHFGQLLLHTNAARWRTLVCGRRFGKSTAAAVEPFLHLYGRPPWLFNLYKEQWEAYRELIGKCIHVPGNTLNPADVWTQQRIWTPPVKRQRIRVIGPHYENIDEIQDMFIKICPPELIVEEVKKKRRLILRGVKENHWLEFRSADAPKTLTGVGLHLGILEECADIDEEVWLKRIRACFSDTRGGAVFIGSPRGMNWFHTLYMRGQDRQKWPQYASWRCWSLVNPHFPEEEWEEARKELPQAIFAQEYQAEFLDNAATVFRKIEEAVRKKFPGDVGPKFQALYKFGIDVARAVDFTVIVGIRKDKKGRLVVGHIDRFHQVDWDLQEDRIVADVKKWKKPAVNMDSTGGYEVLVTNLQRRGLHVNGVNLAGDTKKQLILNLAVKLEQGMIVLPDPALNPLAKILTEELKAYRYEITKSGNVTYSAPNGQHDDCVIALALAVWNESNTATVRVKSYRKKSKKKRGKKLR